MVDKPGKKTITFILAITIILALLKITGAINWSWWWVTMTVWMPIVLTLVIELIRFFMDEMHK